MEMTKEQVKEFLFDLHGIECESVTPCVLSYLDIKRKLDPKFFCFVGTLSVNTTQFVNSGLVTGWRSIYTKMGENVGVSLVPQAFSLHWPVVFDDIYINGNAMTTATNFDIDFTSSGISIRYGVGMDNPAVLAFRGYIVKLTKR